MSYSFRVRFVVSDIVKIRHESGRLPIATGTGEDLTLRSAEDETTISDSRRLMLVGNGYASQAEAEEAGGRWLAILQRALARINVGADFGDRAPKSRIYPAMLRMLEERHGVRVLEDIHGLMVFETEPWPRFALGELTLVAHRPAERLVRALIAGGDAGVSLSDRERTAFDLYSASFFVYSLVDARFLLLMMALETLIEPQTRSQEVITHVDSLIQQTRCSGLPAQEIASLTGSLEWLRSESIGQAGRRLVRQLGDRRYGHNERPGQFFTACYTLRSKLVHGAHPRPGFEEVNSRVGGLELMVSDLLAGELLDRFQLET